MKTEKAIFGAGCFWHVQAEFDKIKGVISTRVGYAGGDESYDKLSYEEVCSDTTGHAEVVEVIFDSGKVSYEKLLEVFWKIHDPTTLNRQGADIGGQYRSIILYHNQKQKRLAISSKNEIERKLWKKVVTEIMPAGKFYPAEEYHQKYLEKKGIASCTI